MGFSWVVPVLLAASWRETAKARVARRLGLEFGKRTSLSVFENVDPWGTIALPAVLIVLWLIDTGSPPLVFAFAKPFSVDVTNEPKPRVALLKVHGAGIIANVAMAAGAAVLLYLAYLLPGGFTTLLVQICRLFLLMNLMLVLFHLIPAPPFDLGRILFARVMPWSDENRLRVALLGGGGIIIASTLAAMWPPIDVNPIAEILWPPAEFLYNQILHILHAL